MKVLFAGSLHEQDRDQKRFFNVNCHKTQWFTKTLYWALQQTKSSVSPAFELSNLQKGSSVRISCCWVYWALQITFLCGLCWFYVRPGNTLLSYLAFSLLCSPRCLLFQNKYADSLPLEASALCSSQGACKYLHHTRLWATRREQPHKEVQQRAGVGSQRVWNQHTAAGAVGVEHLARDCLVFRAKMGHQGKEDVSLGVYA